MSAFPGFLTTYEAAEQLGVSHAQVTRYIKDDLLDAQKQGNQWFIRASSVKKFKPPKRGNPNFQKSSE